MNKKSAPSAKALMDAAKSIKLNVSGDDDVPFVVVESDQK
jgi:hypothetical protein